MYVGHYSTSIMYTIKCFFLYLLQECIVSKMFNFSKNTQQTRDKNIISIDTVNTFCTCCITVYIKHKKKKIDIASKSQPHIVIIILVYYTGNIAVTISNIIL